jgi:hypothetical protein
MINKLKKNVSRKIIYKIVEILLFTLGIKIVKNIKNTEFF